MELAARNHIEGAALLALAAGADAWVMWKKIPTLAATFAGAGRTLPDGVRLFVSASNHIFTWALLALLALAIVVVIFRRSMPSVVTQGWASLAIGWFAIITVVMGLVAVAGVVVPQQ